MSNKIKFLNVKVSKYIENADGEWVETIDELKTLVYDRILIERFHEDSKDGYLSFTYFGKEIFTFGEVNKYDTCSLGDIDVSVDRLKRAIQRYENKTDIVVDLTDVSWFYQKGHNIAC